VYACPEPHCYYRILMRDEHDYTDHKCPFFGDKKAGWSVTKTLVEQVWDLLDRSLDEIMSPSALPKDYHQAQARAYCRVLAIFMQPIFADEDAIADEARKRYKMRKAGEPYETPGLGSLRYAGLPESPSKPRAKSAPSAPKLSAQEIASIKQAHTSGFFSIEDIATTFKITVDQVNTVIAS
jgi:hypothetical protein